MSHAPRQPASSLQGSHPPNKEQGVIAADSHKKDSLRDHTGDRADPSHARAGNDICKPNLPEHLVLHDDEDHPTPPVTPATWGAPPSSTGVQSLHVQPPSPAQRDVAIDRTSDEGLEGCVVGHQENRSDVSGKVDNAVRVPGSSSGVGGLRDDKLRVEMEDFFREDDDRHYDNSMAISRKATGGVKLEGGEAPHRVSKLADKQKGNCDLPKVSEGSCPDNESRGGVEAADNRGVQGPQPTGLQSEECHDFLHSRDHGDNNSVSTRRRKDSDACDGSTPGVPVCVPRERLGTGAHVEREEHDLEQKHSMRREGFDSFLFSDDDSSTVPSRNASVAKHIGDDGSGVDGDGCDKGYFPEGHSTRRLEEQGKHTAKTLADAFSGDKSGSHERIRARPGGGGSDARANLEHGKDPNSEQSSARTPYSVDNDSRRPPRAACEVSDAAGVGNGYNDGVGGTAPTSVTASIFRTDQAPVIPDGGRLGRPEYLIATQPAALKAGSVSSHAYPIAAVGQAGTRSPAPVVTQAIPPCGRDDENSRNRPSSRSPTGLMGHVQRAMTPGMDTPPMDQDGEREVRMAGTPPTARTAGKTKSPRGRTGWSPTSKRQVWETLKNDDGKGTKEVGGISLKEVDSTRAESSYWEAWINGDGEDESDNDEPVRGETHEGQKDQESPAQTRRRSSVSPPAERKVSSDARPWLLQLSPQWIDFKRRRSSLLSHHFSNGSRISRTTSNQGPRLGRLGSAAHLRPGTALACSRTLSEQLKPSYGGAGVAERNRSRPKNLPPCTEVDHKAAANETSAVQDADVGGNFRTPPFSRYPQDEKKAEARATAGWGRHRRPSGSWALDISTHDSSFSGFSSEIDGSKSSIEVHNFLEESVGSTGEEGGSRDGAESSRADGPCCRGGASDGRNNDGGGNDLDAQDIRFLSDGKKLRDVLLAVEDLHFSELPLTRQVELMRGLSIVPFSTGDVVFKQGDLSDALYFMLGPAIDPDVDGQDDEYVLLTTETKEKGDEAEGGGGEESKQELPFIPSRKFFGEEGLVYSKEHRRSYTVRAAVDLSLAVMHWPTFAHWREFRLYLLMKKVSLLAKLPCRSQTAVLHALKYADYDPGELIIREGETGDKFYMITRGTVAVTVVAADSQGSVYSTSASSSAADDGDNDNVSDNSDFMAASSSFLAMADDEDRLSDSSGDSRDEKESRYTDAFEAMFLPRTGPATRQTGTATPGATDTAGVEPQGEEAKTPRIGNVVEDTNMGGEEGEEERVPQDIPSQTEFQAQGGRERWSGIDSLPTEKLLTRLYEGNCFGEMGLIYDEPRNASVRAMTEVTCVYLNKGDFRKCLCDKTFNSLMQQAALQTACYREQKAVISAKQQPPPPQQQQQNSARMGTESSTNFATVRAAAAVRSGRRSSFRATEQLTFAEDKKGETNGRVINDYRVCEKIGEGSFGAVYKVVHTHSGETYAMKVITKPKRGRHKRELLERSLRREVSVMQMLKHPNVVTLWEVIDDPRSRKVHMIQELMEGGPLFKEKYAVEPLSEPVAFSKFVQAAKGLQYIHSFGICHGDIKPSNILEDAAGRVKIADFGACVILNSEDEGGDGDISSSGNSLESLNDVGRDRNRRKHRRKKRGQRVGGTPTFHPPELFGEGGFSRISFASDLWALGVTLYQMVIGKMPFFGRTYRALMASIKMEELTFPSECHIEPYLVNLLHRMLDKNPKTRITLEEAMNHEWVTKEGVCLGGAIDIPGRDRRCTEARGGTSRVAGSLGDGKQQRRATLRAEDAPASEGASAGAGASCGDKTNTRKRNGICLRTKDDTGTTASHHGQSSLPQDAGSREDRGRKKIASLPSSMDRSESFLTPGAPVGEETGQQQQQQRRLRQPKQEKTMQEGERGGGAERGRHRRFGDEAAVAAAKRTTDMNKEEEQEAEGDEMGEWSDGDDNAPSPTILEDIMDNCHLFIPQGVALHARTVTLPEEPVAVVEDGGGSGGSGPMMSKLSTTWSPSPPVASESASAPGLQKQPQQQQHETRWGPGATFSTVEGGVEYRHRQTPPRSSPPPPPLLGISLTSAGTPAPPLTYGLTATARDRIMVQETERKNDSGSTTTAAAAAKLVGTATARETNHLEGIPPLPAPQTKEGVDSIATPQAQHQQDNRQLHRGQYPQKPLSGSPFSSPSLLGRQCQREDEKPVGGGGGDCEGKYRSVGSCPTIGATGASPLLARHELTDRSAWERSQRLVRKPDFLMLRVNHILGSNKRVVISSLKAVSSLRASAEGEVGSRRSSVGVKSSKSALTPRFDAHGEFKSLGEETDLRQRSCSDGARHESRKPTTGGGVKTRAAGTVVKRNNQSIGQDSEDSLSNDPRSPCHVNCEGTTESFGFPTTKPSTVQATYDDEGVGDSGGGGRLSGGGGLSCGDSRRESNNDSLLAASSDKGRSESSLRNWAKLAPPPVVGVEDDERIQGNDGTGCSFDSFGCGRDSSRGLIACDVEGDGVGAGDSGELAVGRRKTSARLPLFPVVDEGMGCIEEEPEQLEITPASSIRTNSAKTRASLNAPRATSDSSTSHCGNGYGHDRTEYSSTCTSYVESSGAESGSHGKERWRCGAIPATRETEFGGTRFKGVCAPGGGGVSGAEDGGGSGGGASGVSCTSCAWLASSCEGKGEGGIDASPGDDSSSDGIGESASVADITDCLDFIGEAMLREDAELRTVDSEEILKLVSGGRSAYRRMSSNKSAIAGGSGGSRGAMMKQVRAESTSSISRVFGHVQARAWANQVNIDVGVRFGVSLDQGKRSSMEDAAACLTDAFSVDPTGQMISNNSSGGSGHRIVELSRENEPVQPAATTPAAGAEPTAGAAAAESVAAANACVNTTATTTTTGEAPEAAAYFGLFDGHGGADVAVHLQDFLHLRVLNNPHFPSDIPQAIRSGCLDTDLECLKISESKRQNSIEDAGKAAYSATSLKRQKTEQVFSGAVAAIAIIYRPPAPPAGTMPEKSSLQARSTATALHSTTTAFDSKNTKVSYQPSHPLQGQSHSRTSSSSSSSANSLKKRQHRQPVFLHIANVGDCRAVLCRGGNAVAITTDHTPSVPSEAARVEAAGGFVSRGRVNGILGVSRSFGDIHCKVYPPREGNGLWDEQQVISQPEVHSIELTNDDNFLILACDGVWDVLTNQEAISYVHRRLLTHRDVQRAAVELIDKALVTSGDNCSCIVICLNQVTASKKKRYRKGSTGSWRTGGLEGSIGSVHRGSVGGSHAGSNCCIEDGVGVDFGQVKVDIKRGSESEPS